MTQQNLRFFGKISLVLTAILGVALPCLAEPTEVITPSHYARSRLKKPTAFSETVSVTGQSFKTAQRITTTAAAEFPYSIQLTADSLLPVKKGDVCLVSLYARTIEGQAETSEGQMLIYYQKAGPPWSKSLYKVFNVPRQWTLFNVPFKVNSDYPAGKSTFALGFGAAKQIIEVADVKVLNYGQGYDIDSLPRTTISYAEREPDAAWRKDAAARIEKHRKADLQLTIVDADGKPIPDAHVNVEMTKHAYHFGTAIYVPRWQEQSADGERYRQEILKNFNTIIIENSMKWQGMAGEWGAGRKAAARDALIWAKKNGLTTHGHVLVWPSGRFTPRKLKHLVNKEHATELAATVKKHIEEATTYYDPYVDEWQVVNELWGNQEYVKILGEQAVGEWFRAAHASVPKVPLYINDYGIVSANLNDVNPHPKAYEKTIRQLLAEGAPIGGIGVQSHFGSALTPPTRLYAILDRFGRFGLPIQATEFDVHARDEQVQADYTRDFLTVFFSHPATAGVTFWGFWEGQHWVPHAALVRKNWQYKPNMKAYRDLVFNTWWTRTSGKTNAAGQFSTRGFLGSYEITVEHDGMKQTTALDLAPKGVSQRLVLKQDG